MESARADVLIETIRCLDTGDMPAWPWHIQRLSRSAYALGFKPVPSDLERIVKHAIEHSPPAAAPTAITPIMSEMPDGGAAEPALRRVRLLYQRDGESAVSVTPLAPLNAPARTAFAHTMLGAHAVLDSSESLLRHKATHRPWYAEATEWLERHPALFDLIFFNERGELCEGSRTNVYVCVAGQWFTPHVEGGCLPGTVRARLLEAQRVRACTIDHAMLGDVQAWRVSNGLRGWIDVSLVNDQG